MNCEKCVDIVYRDSTTTIATIWTGANYYIGDFPTDVLEDEADERILTPAEVIQKTPVDYMTHMCRDEDFTDDLLKDFVCIFLQRDLEAKNGPLAQMVEHQAHNRIVQGSRP